MADVRMVVKQNYFENSSKFLQGVAIETEIDRYSTLSRKNFRLTLFLA